MTRIVASCFLVFILSGMTGASPTALSPCYDKQQVVNTQTNGCMNLWKKQTVNVAWKDGHSANVYPEGTGRCGQDQHCTNCETSTLKECWPRFLGPCPSNVENPPGSGCWTGYWAQTVVNQTANTGQYTCPVSGCSIIQTTCQDGASTTYSISHTCFNCG
jgi:hypothetical protein